MPRSQEASTALAAERGTAAPAAGAASARHSRERTVARSGIAQKNARAGAELRRPPVVR